MYDVNKLSAIKLNLEIMEGTRMRRSSNGSTPKPNLHVTERIPSKEIPYSSTPKPTLELWRRVVESITYKQ